MRAMQPIMPATLTAGELYKVLSGLIVPRPIALITTMDRRGRVNAAPYSFFNVLTDEPPIVAFGSAAKSDGSPKDTPRNIEETREFVVNLVDEELAEAMAVCAVDFPCDVEEPGEAGLARAPSTTVGVPRIAGAFAAIECRLRQSIAAGLRSRIILGDVTMIHVADGCMDPKSRRVDLDRYRPIGRLFGDHYVRLTDRIEVRRMNYDAWLRNAAPQA